MRHARLIVANGGSTLLQALACGAACVAVPIARDQALRIGRCVALGVAVEARLDAHHIAARATALLRDERARAELARRAAALELADGADIAVWALGKLIESDLGDPREHHAECRVAGLRSESTVVSASHAGPRRNLGGGRLAGATGALPKGRYGLRTLGTSRILSLGARRRAPSNQVERRRSASGWRFEQAPRVRRGRCHLCAQAAATRRTRGRLGLASPEIRRHVPLGGRGRRRERGAGECRASRGAGSRHPTDLDRDLLPCGSQRRRGCRSDRRVDRKPRN